MLGILFTFSNHDKFLFKLPDSNLAVLQSSLAVLPSSIGYCISVSVLQPLFILAVGGIEFVVFHDAFVVDSVPYSTLHINRDILTLPCSEFSIEMINQLVQNATWIPLSHLDTINHAYISSSVGRLFFDMVAPVALAIATIFGMDLPNFIINAFLLLSLQDTIDMMIIVFAPILNSRNPTLIQGIIPSLMSIRIIILLLALLRAFNPIALYNTIANAIGITFARCVMFYYVLNMMSICLFLIVSIYYYYFSYFFYFT